MYHRQKTWCHYQLCVLLHLFVNCGVSASKWLMLAEEDRKLGHINKASIIVKRRPRSSRRYVLFLNERHSFNTVCLCHHGNDVISYLVFCLVCDHVTVSVSRHRVRGESEAPFSQVPVSASGEAYEENLYLQRQRLHAAVCPAGQKAWVLVCCAAGEVSTAAPPPTNPAHSALEYRSFLWHPKWLTNKKNCDAPDYRQFLKLQWKLLLTFLFWSPHN